jgi:hypothetical protein
MRAAPVTRPSWHRKLKVAQALGCKENSMRISMPGLSRLELGGLVTSNDLPCPGPPQQFPAASWPVVLEGAAAQSCFQCPPQQSLRVETTKR